MKKENTIILIIVGIIAIVVLFFIFLNSQPKVEKELTDSDFKILSASWDEYSMQFRSEGYVADTNQPLDWDKICDYCKNGIEGSINTDGTPVTAGQRCNYANYHVVVEASQELVYNVAIDGIYTEKLRDTDGSMSSVKQGVQNINILLSNEATTNQQIFSNLDVRENHEITICATDMMREKGFVCKSVTLQAKC